MTQETLDTTAPLSLDDSSHFFNRELSLLKFNQRVLELAQDASVPILERLRYLCISSTNLDEFFEVRVSGLKEQLHLGIDTRGPDKMSASEQLAAISTEAHELVRSQYEVLNGHLIPNLRETGIAFIRRTKWTPEIAEWVKNYFHHELLPLLSPLGLDPSHPFPRIQNKSLNFIISLHGRDAFGRESGLAILQAPRSLPRLIELPKTFSGEETWFVFLSSIIHAYAHELFPGMEVEGCHQFRVTRNTDLFVDEEAVEDLKEALAGELPARNYGQAVRLEVADTCTPEALEYLRNEFRLDEGDVFQVHGPVNLNRLSALYDFVDRAELKYPDFEPGLPSVLKQKDKELFNIIREQDVLVHHPYQTFAPVQALLRSAANDPNVLAIKQTLYRTGSNSQLVKHLMRAARNGKEVTVIIELKARFDEQANIVLANQLQDAGCHVVYGVVSHKTHAKLMLIVRRENENIRRYVHLGTGNYHAGTARFYTDIGLFSADPVLGEDVHKVFQQLTGLGRVPEPKKLLQAPFTLHDAMLEKIDREISNARAGKPARIIARMNSLVEPEVIKALYRASGEGIEVDLIVRGICCLRPGIPGVSENIRVRSVMGRFLEHPRIYYFENAGEPEVYGSSADWMPRNFFRRIETAFPIEAPNLKKRVIKEALTTYLEDNTNAWLLQSDGQYQRVSPGESEPLTAQTRLMESMGTIHWKSQES